MNRLFHRLLPLFALLLAIAGAAPAGAVTDEEIASITVEEPAANGAAQTARGGGLLGKTEGDAPSLAGMAVRLSVALGIVFALMAGVLWAARRWLPAIKQGGPGGAIEIAAAKQLGQRRSLLLVRVQGRMLLLGVTPQAINVLSELDNDALAWNEAARRAGLPAAGLAEDDEPHDLAGPRGTTSLGGIDPEVRS